MSKLIILQGIPGSGKTTYARQFCKDHDNYVRVNRDDIRNMLGEYWVPKREKLVTELEDKCIYRSLVNGYNVIVDATNFNPKTIERIKLVALDASINIGEYISVEFYMLDTPIEECIARDALREKPVGEKVIKDFAKKYLN